MLAMVTGTMPSAWMDEDPRVLATAFEVLEERMEQEEGRGA